MKESKDEQSTDEQSTEEEEGAIEGERGQERRKKAVGEKAGEKEGGGKEAGEKLIQRAREGQASLKEGQDDEQIAQDSLMKGGVTEKAESLNTEKKSTSVIEELTHQARHKKTLTGEVVSDKMDKTVVVEVERLIKHPIYKKYIKRSRKFKAHDKLNKAKMGEIVKIVECRPYSKDKTFRILEIGKEKEIGKGEKE